MSNNKCLRTTESKGSLGTINYHTCQNPVKYFVKYKEPVRGTIKEERICGMHFYHLKNNLEKMNRNFITKEKINDE